jgi:protoheme IX farnesyltransferase
MSRSSAAAAYLSLTKPTIVLLFGVTGYAVLLSEGSLGALKVLCVMLAMVATAGSANALNMYFDRDIDAVMERTKRRRPIPSEKISPERAAIFGLILGALAIAYFCVEVNYLAAFLSFFTIAFYVGIYTLCLKRRTPYNIVIGGIAGSTAPLIGAAAATGHLSPLSWVLFGVVFLWTPPHFWALAIAIQDECAYASCDTRREAHSFRNFSLYNRARAIQFVALFSESVRTNLPRRGCGARFFLPLENSDVLTRKNSCGFQETFLGFDSLFVFALPRLPSRCRFPCAFLPISKPCVWSRFSLALFSFYFLPSLLLVASVSRRARV